jgi:hypothetical protein
MDTLLHRSFPRRALVLALVFAVASGCARPRHCVETYSPLVKLLMGLPIPMLFTVAIAAALTSSIDGALGRSNRLNVAALLAVAVTCTEPAVFGQLLPWSEASLVALPVSLFVVAFLGLRDPRPDPMRESWMHRLSRAADPTPANRVGAGVLAVLLALTTLIGSGVASYLVVAAGRQCGVVEPPGPGKPLP